MNKNLNRSARVSVCLIAAGLALGNGCSHTATTYTNERKAGTTYQGEYLFLGQSKVKRYQLRNGLKVLILEDHSSPTFAYQTWFDVGSRDEQKGLTGLAHLFEHMMFKDTKNHSAGEFDRLLEQAGAEGKNAFTSNDYTAYIQSLPSHQLPLVASLESDRMVNLLVNDQSLDKEREVVKNERRFRKENSPDGTMYERMMELAFEKHPYHWPVIGYERDLDNAKSKECLDFYRNHYSPNNATIVLVGDVNPNQAISIIENYYGALEPQPVRRYSGAAEPRQKHEKRVHLQLPIAVEKLYVAYHVPALNHADVPSIELLNNIVGHTNSSNLYRKLVDGGIAASVDSFHDSHKDSGLFIIVANMQKGKKASAALKIIDQELNMLTKQTVTDEELQTAKAQYKYELFDDLGTNYSKARNLGFFEIVAGNFSRGPEIVKLLDQLSAKDLQIAAKEYFLPQNRTIVMGLPKGQKQ